MKIRVSLEKTDFTVVFDKPDFSRLKKKIKKLQNLEKNIERLEN